MRIALVSEHASPLAAIGGVDASGQKVHVAELAAGLVRHGHSVSVYTRRDAADLAERVTTSAGYEVVHVPAGPATPVPEDGLWAHAAAFANYLTEMSSSNGQMSSTHNSGCQPGHRLAPPGGSISRCW